MNTNPELSALTTAAGRASWQIVRISEDSQPQRWTFTSPSGAVQ